MTAARHPPSFNRSHALFLDFDGTLVDLAARPESVRPDPQLVGLLQQSSGHLGGALAILTGRRLQAVDDFLPGFRSVAAGLHGAQQRDAPASAIVDLAAPAGFVSDLRVALQPWAGLWLEDKGSAVAIHYREVPYLGDQALKLLQQAVDGDTRFEIVGGKFVHEARPVDIDKGVALRRLMALKPFIGRVPIFIGDDRTDEDAIIAAQALGGLGIKVGPGATAARHHLIDPQAVLLWLRNALHQSDTKGA